MVRVCLFGAITVAVDDASPTPVTQSRVRLLLAILGAHHGTVLPAQRLIDLMWPDGAPKTAETSLQVAVSKLRNLLEPQRESRAPSRFLHTTPHGYRLDLDAHQLDIAEFERSADVGRSERDGASAEATQALEIWQDPPLAEFVDRPWARATVDRLSRLRTAVVAAEANRAMHAHRHQEAVTLLLPEVRRVPTDEGATAMLMLALYRSGRQIDALRLCEDLRRRMREDLGVQLSPQILQLEQSILQHDRDLLPRGGTRPARPATDRLIGRTDDIRAIEELVRNRRIVTLVGAAGAGKTTLARAAMDAAGMHTRFVDLTTVDTGERVARRIAGQLALGEAPNTELGDLIVEQLETTDQLLVIDNAEHVLDAVASLLAGLGERGQASVLVTSRRPLGLLAEHVHRVEPLALAASDDIADVAAAPACRLLLERSGVELSESNTTAIAEIARRLDGLPLAIELAAFQLRSLPPSEVLNGLELDVQPRGPADLEPRHRTLDAALSASTAGLDAGHLDIMFALATAAGPLPSSIVAHFVGAPLLDVQTRLATLVDRSLVRADHESDEATFGLLETVASFCRRRMTEQQTLETWRDRHLDVVRTVAMAGENADVTLTDIPLEVPAALDWLESGAGEDDDHVQFVAGIGAFWFRAGQPREARERMLRSLETRPGASAIWRGITCGAAGLVSFSDGQFATLERLVDEALSVLEPLGIPALEMLHAAKHLARHELDDVEPAMRTAVRSGLRGRNLAIACDMAAHAAWFRDEHATALDWFADLQVAAEAAGESYFVGRAQRGRGLMSALLGSPESGLALCQRTMDRITDWSADRSTTQALATRAAIHQIFGNEQQAAADARAALERAGRRFDWIPVMVAAPVLLDALVTEDPTAFAELSGWLRGVCDSTGMFLPAAAELELVRHEQKVRSELGDRWSQYRATGAAQPLSSLLGQRSG